jgi:predicted Zn-dependent protease
VRPAPSIPLIAALLLTLTLAGPAAAQPQQDSMNLPELGPAGSNVITPQQEDQLGRSVVAQIRDQHALLDDPLVTAYIQHIGHRLSSHSDRPDLDFTFFVVNDNEINAFALPGGYVGVNSGLITDTDNEDELAGVMAHEISHVTQRHIARQMEGSKLTSIGALAGLIGAIIVG